MRGFGSTVLALAASAVALLSSAARADTMDPALNRFVMVDANNPDCRTSGPGGGVYYNPLSGYRRCTPDNVPWANLVAQFGSALGPNAMHAARTSSRVASGATVTTSSRRAGLKRENTLSTGSRSRPAMTLGASRVCGRSAAWARVCMAFKSAAASSAGQGSVPWPARRRVTKRCALSRRVEFAGFLLPDSVNPWVLHPAVPFEVSPT